MTLSALDTSFEAELRALIFLFILDEPTNVDYLVERQDLGQMPLVDNIKYMPDITELQSRCNLIYVSQQEGHGRYGFLEDIHDEEIIDAEEPDAQ